MHPSEILIILCTICVSALLAHRLRLAPPIAFLFGGLLLALLGLHAPEIEPEHMLLLFLPPILMEAAFFTSLREFRANLRPILLLAVGLVAITAFAVGGVIVQLIPGANWALGILLGAIISPPDAAAATSALRGAPIPRKIINILEGESLVNDASGIVLYKFAVAAVVTASFSMTDASVEFVWKSGAGILVGLALAYLFVTIYPLLREPSAEILFTFLPPYAAYMMAESIGASGVLAVVACGLLVGWHAPNLFHTAQRQPTESVWRMVVFCLNALAFLLIGLQLPELVSRLGYSPVFLGAMLLAVSLTAIGVRFLYVYANAYIVPYIIRSRFMPSWLRRNDTSYDAPPWQNIFLVSWTGMRGVVTLALALALPTHLLNGDPFPHRDLIVFLSVGVILVTLVLQGATLPWLSNKLSLRFDPKRMQEEWLARVNTTRRALSVLDELEKRDGIYMPALTRIRDHYRERLEGLGDGPNTPLDSHYEGSLDVHPLVLAENRIWQEVLKHERDVLLQMRREFTIDDEVMYDILRELDMRSSSFHADLEDGHHVSFTTTITEIRTSWFRRRGRNRAAFSLVELSIVLVILGLLVGGILAGQSLIRASELRAQIGQVNRIETAYMAFRDKYIARPGDMPNATSFWASTANGNGDGILNGATGDRGSWSSENARFFEQLALAGLIDGTYSASGALGTGFPTLKYNPAAGMMANMPPVQFGAEFRPRDGDRNWKNAWYLYMYLCNVAAYPTVQNMNNCGIFTPTDTWNMDTKTDDGTPYTGRFIAIGESGYACFSNTTSPGTYNLSNNTPLCTAGWQLD